MVQLGYRTTEEMLIVAWTALLHCMSKCQLVPVVCDVMTDVRAISGLGVVVLVLVLMSQVLPYTRYGKMNPYRDPSPDKTLFTRLADSLQHMTLLEGVRVVLGVLTPTLGTMLVMHPGSVGALCVLKKAAMLERRLWNRWCPEAYIILVSIGCTLIIARRSSFSQKVRRHDRFKRQSHAHFYNPDPRFNYGMA